MAKMVLKTKSDKPVLTGSALTAVSDLEDIKEGDKLTSDAVIAKYARLYANDKSDGDEIDLPTEDILAVVRSVPGDNAAAWEARSDELWNMHNKEHPTPDISVGAPQGIRDLFSNMSDEFADIFGDTIKTREEIKYGAALLMFALEQHFGDRMPDLPKPDTKAPDNYKANDETWPEFDLNYRSKPAKAKGAVSWYADAFDNMPSKHGRMFGQEIAGIILAIDGLEGEYKAMGKKERETERRRYSQRRTAGIGLMKRAAKLWFQMRELNGFDKVKCELRFDSKGQVLRTPEPIKVYDNKVGGEYDYFSIGSFLGLQLDKLSPKAATFAEVQSSTRKADKTGQTVTVEPLANVKEAETELARLATFCQNPGHWSNLAKALEARDNKTGELLNVPLIEYVQSIGDEFESIRPTLEKLAAELRETKAERAKAERVKTAKELNKAHA